MRVKEITPSSWIVTSSITEKKIGLVIKKDSGFCLVTEPNKIYESFEKIAEVYKETLETEQKEAEETVSDINGYPVKHEKVFDIAIDEESNFNTYKAKEGSKVVFVAGYFGVKSKSGYNQVLCPKIETLLENDYIGPYKDKFDARFHITKHNRDI